MFFSFWYNRCCVDPVTAIAISANKPPEYVDLIRYVYPADLITNSDSGVRFYRCACDRCKGELSAIVIDTAQNHIETALNINPMLVHIVRLNTVPHSHNVVYTFIIPSLYNARVLNTIAKQLNVLYMFVSTRLNLINNVEDTSFFKLRVVQRHVPCNNVHRYIDWMAEQIRRIINCKPVYHSTNYISSFTPCSYLAPKLWLDR